MSTNEEAIAERLSAISEELAELAIDRLKQAMRADEHDRASLAASEKRITRARRAVEKATQLLSGSSNDED
jgi:hypothetical protein